MVSHLRHVQLVDMTQVPFPKPPNKMCWRFLAALDKEVDVFPSRDTDNDLIARDRDAVIEWLYNTSYECHVMCDHVLHITEMLGGMWGYRGQPTGTLLEQFRKMIWTPATQKGSDQAALREHLFPHVSCLAHDSYLCGQYNDTEWQPFPSQREGDARVGVLTGNLSPVECPERCRRRPDWTTC